MYSIRHSFFFRRVGLAAIGVAALALATARTAQAVPPCSTSPSLTSVDPAFGSVVGGYSATLLGSGFCSGGLKVWFGANKVSNADVSFTDSGTISIAHVPASTVVGPVTVRVQQTTTAKTKQSRLVNGFEYTCDGCTVSPVSLQFEGVDPVQQTTEPNGVLEPGETSVLVKPTVLNSSGVTENPVTGSITVTGPQNAATDITYTADDDSATYGSIASGATADCGSDCYALTITIGGSGNRPTINTASDIDWDATMTETPAVNAIDQAPIDWRVHVGGTFSDVPTTFLLYDYVERLVHNHVTFGTGGTSFNPGGHASRIQMSAFIARAFAGGDANVPSSGTITSADNPTVNGAWDCSSGGTSLYADIAPTNGFCRYVHYITSLNVTNGCDSVPDFCPSGLVSRRVMSVFISRALVPGLGDGGVPDANTGTGAFASRTYDCVNGPGPFSDVPAGSSFCKNIGYIWTLGVVDGNNGAFDPSALVTRAQMAKFLDNAFQLTIGPGN